MMLDELIQEYEELGDWDEQCDYLIDLGFDLQKLPEEAKTEANRVHGCQSNVWMTAEVLAGEQPAIRFVANSDAIIVNGLIAVLMAMYDGRTPEDVLSVNAEAVFKRLGLERHLSPQRRNGLYGMVTRIRELAARAVTDPPPAGR